MVTYPGKIRLIATGFAGAAIAVRSAVEYVRPEVSAGNSLDGAAAGGRDGSQSEVGLTR
jgi:hypothetical protein